MEQVKELMGVGEGTIKKMFNEEDFPAIRIGKTNLVLFKALMEYLGTKRDLRGK